MTLFRSDPVRSATICTFASTQQVRAGLSKSVHTERSANAAAKAQKIALESPAHPRDDDLEYVFDATNMTLEVRVAKAAAK